MTRARYDVYLNTPGFPVAAVAELAVEEDARALLHVGFRYRPDYLAAAGAFSLDPSRLPVAAGETRLFCQGGAPAILDDYLPDAWGRRVMVRLARARLLADFDANSVIDSLALVGSSRIGALSIVPRGEEPRYRLGEPVSSVAAAERVAQQIDRLDFEEVDAAAMGLLYLANSGTGVGGARPKALLWDEHGSYLAKFNRQRLDDYNNARVELACLHMARAAGLDVGEGRVLDGINGREVLLLERFDLAPGGQRYHLITANGLLKEPGTQRDPGRAFRYDMVAELIATHVEEVAQSLIQLLRLMLFNVAIHNTDDHERNFSFIQRNGGYQLAPAYDLVPSLTSGNYHAAGFKYAVIPPRPSEIGRHGKVFGLAKPVVARIAEQVIEAVSRWMDFADAVGVSEEDAARVARVLKP